MKAAAGKKAFITNRVGDAGFLLGMFLLWFTVGTLDMDQINAAFLGTNGAALPAVSAARSDLLLVHRRDRQIGADPAVRLAARRDGRPYASLGTHPRGDHGHGGRLHRRTHERRLRARAARPRRSS